LKINQISHALDFIKAHW